MFQLSPTFVVIQSQLIIFLLVPLCFTIASWSWIEQSDGSAAQCADLHVGHILLEIDGVSTENCNHAQVAQMISKAYYSTPHKDYIEFLVREKLRSEFDLRRSSFMLLNNSYE